MTLWRNHQPRKSGGARCSATVINPPASFVTMRARRMRNVRTNRYGTLGREVAVVMVSPLPSGGPRLLAKDIFRRAGKIGDFAGEPH